MSSERFDKFLKVRKRWASPYPQKINFTKITKALGGRERERERRTSIGLKLLPDIINRVIHSSIFIFFSVNFKFCFITQLLFVLADLYENTHSVYKQLIFFGQALCLLKLGNHLRSQVAQEVANKLKGYEKAMKKNHAKLRVTESFFTQNLNMPRHVFLINL